MPDQNREVRPGLQPRTVRTLQGVTLQPPVDWELLPPGDAMLTRRVKQAGPCWTVREPRGRKVFSHGVWAPKDRIGRLRAEVAAERAAPAYGKNLAAGRARRAAEHVEYVDDFRTAVLRFLAFAPPHIALAEDLASAIADHATPVGSGTVARTKRLPIGKRAAAATIAWLRHQTTDYDTMQIARFRGRRRDIRRLLAERSLELLARYRRGESIAGPCSLRAALERLPRTDTLAMG